MEIKVRALRPPAGSYFLFGARGTGKSSFVRRQYPGALYIDLLDPAAQREYLTRPERLAELVRDQPTDRIVVFTRSSESGSSPCETACRGRCRSSTASPP
jgi:hypothetical protein